MNISFSTEDASIERHGNMQTYAVGPEDGVSGIHLYLPLAKTCDPIVILLNVTEARAIVTSLLKKLP